MLFSKLEFYSISQVDVACMSTSVSPLFLRERELIYVVFET